MGKNREKKRQRNDDWMHAKVTAYAGYDFENQRPLMLETLATAAEWNKGVLELKRTYNEITGKKYFNHHTGELLIKVDNKAIFGRTPRKKRK